MTTGTQRLTVQVPRWRSARADTTPATSWDQSNAWRPSRVIHGTPGRAPLVDFDGDRQLTVSDVDLVCAGIQAMDLRYDLTHDDQLGAGDLLAMVQDAGAKVIGDVSFDGLFGTADLVQVFQRGGYEDAIPNNSQYSGGDWNCDGDFTTRDLVFAFQQSPYEGV